MTTSDADSAHANSSIERLPDEILTLVLAAVRHDNVKHLARAIRVSKHWSHVGNQLLWHDVVLNYTMISSFCRCIELNIHVPDFRQRLLDDGLRSLTIHGSIEAERFSFQHTAHSHRTLHDLSNVLPKLSGLQTFSFNHSNTSADPWSLDQMTDEIVVSLIEELPASLRHLEINCPTVYFRCPRTTPCLCEILARRLEGLVSLRLAWPRLCSALLECRSSTLKYAIIDTCKPDLRAGVKHCKVDDQGHLSWDQVQARGNNLSRRAVAAFLETLKEKCSTRDWYPCLDKFTVLEPYHFMPQDSHYQWFSLNVHSISGESVDSGAGKHLQTICYPVWPTGFVNETLEASNEYSFIIRTCDDGPHLDHTAIAEHDCSSSDKVTDKQTICELWEGEAGWISDTLHSRRPKHIIQGQPRTHVRLISKPQWEERYRTHRRKVLRDQNEMNFFHHDPDTVASLTLEGLQLFHSTHGVKAKEAGADYIWWLERKLKVNVLHARNFPGGIYQINQDDQLIEKVNMSCFTSYGDEIKKVQSDIILTDHSSVEL